jgi:hypothetical protein
VVVTNIVQQNPIVDQNRERLCSHRDEERSHDNGVEMKSDRKAMKCRWSLRFEKRRLQVFSMLVKRILSPNIWNSPSDMDIPPETIFMGVDASTQTSNQTT